MYKQLIWSLSVQPNLLLIGIELSIGMNVIFNKCNIRSNGNFNFPSLQAIACHFNSYYISNHPLHMNISCYDFQLHLSIFIHVMICFLKCHDAMQVALSTKEGVGIEYDEDIVCDVCRVVSLITNLIDQYVNNPVCFVGISFF